MEKYSAITAIMNFHTTYEMTLNHSENVGEIQVMDVQSPSSLLTMTIILWQLRNNRGNSVRATTVSFNESIAAFQCFVAGTVVAVQALILFAALDTSVRTT